MPVSLAERRKQNLHREGQQTHPSGESVREFNQHGRCHDSSRRKNRHGSFVKGPQQKAPGNIR